MKPAKDAYNNIITRFMDVADASFTARSVKMRDEYVDRASTTAAGLYWWGEWDFSLSNHGLFKSKKINVTAKCYIGCDTETIYNNKTKTWNTLFQKRRPHYSWIIWVSRPGKSTDYTVRFYQARLKDAIAFTKALRTFAEWDEFADFLKREVKKADASIHQIRKIDEKNLLMKEIRED